MQVVAIIGAGELGGALAHTLACRGRVSEIRLIDEAAGVAAGKALDIQQAGPIEGFGTRVVAHADIGAAAGAAVVVLADRPGSSPAEWSGEGALALVKRLAAQDPHPVIVCAGATQRQLVERGVIELHIPREHLVCSAPEALASAVRAMVAVETNGSPADVALSVLGVPPDHLVVPWDDASIAGYSAARVLEPPQLQRLALRVRALWPPGPYSLASAASRAAEAVAIGSRRLLSCFLLLDGELGTRRVVSAFPVLLGPDGVERMAEPTLSVRDRVLFENGVNRQDRQ